MQHCYTIVLSVRSKFDSHIIIHLVKKKTPKHLNHNNYSPRFPIKNILFVIGKSCFVLFCLNKSFFLLIQERLSVVALKKKEKKEEETSASDGQ